MTEEEIFEIVKDQIVSVIPSLPRDRIRPESRLEDLGADSVDRSDILTGTLDRMKLELRLVTLGETKNLGGLVRFLHQAQHP